MTTENQFLKAALEYHKLGWSIIPIAPCSKISLISWAIYQKTRASEEQIRKWWHEHPDASIGLVLGRVSGIFAVDIDDDNGIAALKKYNISLDDEPTPLQKTSRGFHYIFAYPEKDLCTKKFDGGEIRSDGSYILLAPSRHPSGCNYKWILSPLQQNPTTPPNSLINFCKKAMRSPNQWLRRSLVTLSQRVNEIQRFFVSGVPCADQV